MPQGMEFVKDLGFRDFIVEGDSKSIIQKMSSNMDDRSSVRPLIADAKELSGSRAFHSCRFSFIGRNGNQLAHEMTVTSKTESEDRYWVQDVPNNARSLAASDRR
ncbi:hypothetical protein V6N13_001712 [Hibiscus sabdariffa]